MRSPKKLHVVTNGSERIQGVSFSHFHHHKIYLLFDIAIVLISSFPRNSVFPTLILGVMAYAIRAISRLRYAISVYLPLLMSCKVDTGTP